MSDNNITQLKNSMEKCGYWDTIQAFKDFLKEEIGDDLITIDEYGCLDSGAPRMALLVILESMY